MSQAGPVGRAGSFSRDPGTSEKHTKNQVCDYMDNLSPDSRDPGITMPGSRQTGLRLFHVIAFTGTPRLAGQAISNYTTQL